MSQKQQETATEQRREKFLTEFTQNSKYQDLRNRLKQAIFRLAVEKFKKQVGPEPLSDGERSKFKASLYIFLQKKLKDSLSEAMDRSRSEPIHSDISKQYFNLEERKAERIGSSHKENLQEKFNRLAIEFDQINDVDNAEKNFVNQLILSPQNDKKWGEYAMFCLKNDLQMKGEQSL